MSWSVPLTDLVLSEADIDSYLDTLRTGWLTMGPRTQEFEAAFAELLGVEHAVAVSSGTAALHLALLAAGVGPGDEVIVPDMTFVAGPAAVRYVGAVPVFADSVGPGDLNLDPHDVERSCTARTRAVLATHWWGYACDLDRLRALCGERELVLIEDCAQALLAECADGRFTGTVGAAGCFSFFSKKLLTTGEGGMVITADAALAGRVRSFRSHTMTSVTWDRHRGHSESYDITGFGFNYRMDEPRASLGLSRLPRILDDIARRRELVRRYRSRFAEWLPQVTVPWTEEDVGRASPFAFGVVFADQETRDRVEQGLNDRRIQTTRYPALSSLSAYREWVGGTRAADIAERHLVLPLAASFEDDTIDRVVAAVDETLCA